MITGISARLLLLTIFVVMIVEVAIFVPSIAQFRKNFLEERLVRAEIAALTIMAAPGGLASPELEAELLGTADALNIVVTKEGSRILALPGSDFSAPAASFDLRTANSWDLIRDAMYCLFFSHSGEVQRVIGETGEGMYERVEITFRVEELRQAMLDYGLRILQLSLIISIITAGVVFVTVRRFVVAPLLDVIRNVERFHENPEDPERVMQARSGAGEVAEAERAIAAMQSEVLTALGQRRRLAELGEAVAKINHDLRNMLAAGQLMTERLGASDDPLVARVLPKLVGSLDRASALCQSTLDYGRAEEPEPELRPVALAGLVEDVVEGLGLAGEPAEELGDSGRPTLGIAGSGTGEAAAAGGRVLASGAVRVVSGLPPGATVLADQDFLYRILANLIRNASEAIRGGSGRGSITILLEHSEEMSSDKKGSDKEETCRLILRDTGPGLPEKARAHLFRPFRSSAKRGGTGLGLTIAAELARAQGGQLELLATSPAGTAFALTLRPATAQTRLPRTG